jgi:DNA anti-recombination protein RmuC
MTSFDAHQYAKRLIDAGASPAEADVHAAALTQVTDEVAILEGRVDAQQCKAESSDVCLGAQIEKSRAELSEMMNGRFAEFGEKVNDRFTEFGEKVNDRFTEFGEKVNDRFNEFGEQVNERLNEFGEQVNDRFNEFGEKINERFNEFGEKVNERFIAQDRKIAELSEKIEAAKSESVRWTIGIVLGVASLQTGLIAAMLHWMR